MIPSRRQGRPPRAPSSQAGRMKHLARKRRFEGRFGLFLACIEVFMAVRLVLADSSVIDVSDIPIIGLGAEKTDAEGLGKDAGMIPASIGSEKCSVASGNASACSRFVANAGFTSEQLGFGDGCGVGNVVAEEVQASTIVLDASRVADDPSFSLGSPFEASLAAGLSSSFGSRPLCDISNTLQAVSSSSGSQGLSVPVEIDDAYMNDFDMVLKEKPNLKKYFRDPVENVVASGSVSISGNKIENLVIHVATLSEAGSVLKSLK